ncbi:MAG: outer membrane protein assembly factor BamE domain-containing protein [Planctomycetota bacterium]|jgi:hypothetical protein
MARIITVSLLLLLAGCAATEADLEKVEFGMTKDHVKKIMGKPAVVTDTAWIYHNVGNLDHVHFIFKNEKGEPTDRVTDIVRFERDPQMIGEPR